MDWLERIIDSIAGLRKNDILDEMYEVLEWLSRQELPWQSLALQENPPFIKSLIDANIGRLPVIYQHGIKMGDTPLAQSLISAVESGTDTAFDIGSQIAGVPTNFITNMLSQNPYEARQMYMAWQLLRHQRLPEVPPTREEVQSGGSELQSPEDWWAKNRRR